MFALSTDMPLTANDTPFIRENLKSFLIVDKNESKTNELVVKLFVESLFEQQMGRIQFMRALKHAFKTPTYGNKDLLSKILSYDKTIKTFTREGVLKQLQDGLIERTSDMMHVEFVNGRRAYIHNADFNKDLMELARPMREKPKNKRYYTDPKTGEKYEI